MKVIDLTHSLYEDMPVFPGTEQPTFEKVYTVKNNGFQETNITMYSHTGTHIDAPAHMFSNGAYLENFKVEQFIGQAIILDFSDENVKVIDAHSLKAYAEKIKNVEFIIIKTGWSKYWGEKKYYEDFPALSVEAAEWLANFKLKGIGIDTISIDAITSKTFDVHRTLMPKNIIIIENLTNLDAVSTEYFTLSVLPLKYKDADGSPVRAIAIES